MENSIFLGNGFNRVSSDLNSWNNLLKKISLNKIIDDIPNTLQYEDLYLAKEINLSGVPAKVAKYSKEFQFKYKIAELVSQYSPNILYRLLADIDVCSYITTNYDNALECQLMEDGYLENISNSDVSEQLYSIRRHHSFIKNDREIMIWPIHGEAKYPKSIMLGYDHYCGAIGKVDSFIKGFYEYRNENSEMTKMSSIVERFKSSDKKIYSWIDLFFMHNLHIIGFGLDYSEQDIWFILNKRQRYIKENKIDITNQIYFYGCIDHNKEMLLKDFGVNVFSYNTPKKQTAWIELYKKMINDLQSNIS